MFDIKALRQRKTELIRLLSGQVEAAEKAGKPLSAFLTEEQKAEREKWKVELAETNERITEVEAAMDRERGLTAEDRAAATRQTEARRETETNRPKFANFGEFVRAVYLAGIGVARDPRLQVVGATGDIQAAASGLNESIPSEGGFLVQQEFASEIFTMMHGMGQILSRCATRPIGPGFNGVKINAVDESSRATGSRWGGVRGYWLAEAGALTSSMPKFRQVDLRLEKCGALYYATEEELQDAVGLSAVLTQAFAEEITFTVEDALWRGDGAGKPLGAAVAANPSRVSVAKESGQAAATFVGENASKMWARLPARSQLNAAWFINVDVQPQLDRLHYAVKNVAGTENVGGVTGPILYTPPGVGGAPFATMMGRPVIPVEYAETLGTQGDVLLADWMQYQVIEKGLRSDVSMHVRFLNDEQTFRIIYRVNGQPKWNKPLTPFKGAATLSPFVVLDTRA